MTAGPLQGDSWVDHPHRSPVATARGELTVPGPTEAGPSTQRHLLARERIVESRFDVKGKGRAIDAVEGVEGSALLVSGEGERPRVDLVYRTFQDEEKDLQDIMRLCDQELSEPYV